MEAATVHAEEDDVSAEGPEAAFRGRPGSSLERGAQARRRQPFVGLRGDIKLPKLLQKRVAFRSGCEQGHRRFDALVFNSKPFVQRWRFIDKPGHSHSFQALGGSITGLSVTDVSHKAAR